MTLFPQWLLDSKIDLFSIHSGKARCSVMPDSDRHPSSKGFNQNYRFGSTPLRQSAHAAQALALRVAAASRLTTSRVNDSAVLSCLTT
jgi:hypothetical protein